MNDEIALFIDFENIRYSLINVQHREPDPQELIGQARRFGTVMVARAYADWSRQPEFFKGSLMAAMIDRVDCPAKVRERFRPNAPQPFFQQGPYNQGGFNQGPYNPFQARDEHPLNDDDGDGYEDDDELHPDSVEAMGMDQDQSLDGHDDGDELEPLDEGDDDHDVDERHGRGDQHYGYNNGGYQQPPQIITQSTVDLNMLMDIIENVFDRPTISTFVLMTGDRDFTRICARLKVRLNKRVIVIGVPGTVSRDLISAADTFVPLGVPNAPFNERFSAGYRQQGGGVPYGAGAGPVLPDEPGFIQFLDYIDSHWSWRTIGGVANFIGDPFNPKNRFRGRLTRDSARDLLRVCVDDGILLLSMDPQNGENLRLNRDHPAVLSVLNETVPQ